jgi:hypothetical protein
MDALYQKVVFDEWAVISLSEKGSQVPAYTGPRKADFQKNFLSDVGELRAELRKESHNIGDFEFARRHPLRGVCRARRRSLFDLQ